MSRAQKETKTSGFIPKIAPVVSMKCAEFACAWNFTHWENGANYGNGCYKYGGDIAKCCKGIVTVQEAKAKGLI